MNIIPRTEIYQCSYCKKLYLRKHMCVKHEEFCGKKPENQPACSYCNHLRKFIKCIDEPSLDDNYPGVSCKGFFCSLKVIEMYPLKAIRKKLVKTYPHTFKDLILMPHKCSDYYYGESVIISIKEDEVRRLILEKKYKDKSDAVQS